MAPLNNSSNAGDVLCICVFSEIINTQAWNGIIFRYKGISNVTIDGNIFHILAFETLYKCSISKQYNEQSLLICLHSHFPPFPPLTHIVSEKCMLISPETSEILFSICVSEVTHTKIYLSAELISDK